MRHHADVHLYHGIYILPCITVPDTSVSTAVRNNFCHLPNVPRKAPKSQSTERMQLLVVVRQQAETFVAANGGLFLQENVLTFDNVYPSQWIEKQVKRVTDRAGSSLL